MDIFYYSKEYLNVYERLIGAGHAAKICYYDQASSTMEVLNLLQNQPKLFGAYDQFLEDCKSGTLPRYSFIEPNYTDYEGEDGDEAIASDQHPDHDVQQGKVFVASVYNAIRQNPDLWKSTALLIAYHEHGGICDHVSLSRPAISGGTIWRTAMQRASPYAPGTSRDRSAIRLGWT